MNDYFMELKKLKYRKDARLVYNTKNNHYTRLNNDSAVQYFEILLQVSNFEDAIKLIKKANNNDNIIDIQFNLNRLINSIFQENVPRKADAFFTKNALAYPLNIEFELTTLCNWKCPFCYNTWRSEKCFKHRSLDINVLKSIIDEANYNNCFTIRYSGGEPLLYPYLKELIEYGNYRKMNQIIFTNGSLITDEWLEIFEKNKVKTILLSLHGIEEGHDNLTKIKGSYLKTISTIKKIIKTNLHLCVEVTLSKINITEIENILCKLISIGVKNISIMRYVSTGRNDKDFEISYEEFYKIINEIANNELFQNLSIKLPCSQKMCLGDRNLVSQIKNNDKLLDMLIGSCQAGIRWCSISVDGNIRICPHSTKIYGNVYENNSLKKAWKKMNYAIERQLKNINKECYGCSLIEKCEQGCRLDRIDNL